MIDLGLSKMALIGAVALIVIGPEKLPRVARTVGTLLGKAQRYVNEVKAEVNRSMELDELRKMKDTVENAARDVENSIQSTGAEFEKQWQDAAGSLDALFGCSLAKSAKRVRRACNSALSLAAGWSAVASGAESGMAAIGKSNQKRVPLPCALACAPISASTMPAIRNTRMSFLPAGVSCRAHWRRSRSRFTALSRLRAASYS